MSNLSEKSIQTLELPVVLELLAREAVTEEGKLRALSLRPSACEEEVFSLLSETTAARRLMDTRGTPPFSFLRPISASLRRAEQGGALSTRELLDVAAVLRTARAALTYYIEVKDASNPLEPLFCGLSANRFLEDGISKAIPAEDEVSDAASPELAAIRKKYRITEGDIRTGLQRLISSKSKFLQEPILTLRSGRYVVPVKSEHKNDIPGLVHDVSSSGATFFIEPMAVVQANNTLRELLNQEKQEIDRILAALSAQAAEFQADIQKNYDLLVRLDVIFARGKLSFRMRGCMPRLQKRGVSLIKARHPLLDPKHAVANDLSLGSDFDTLVVTGPNTGGKTVTLKTLGLLSLMAQCGLHLPADDGSAVCVFRRILADIGDEQSIAQSLSTFSSHMKKIVAMLAETDENTLVLFDELGAGTDPVEGAALAAAIIESTREKGALAAATTHYAELKVYAMTTAGVENASCEFDVETLSPTYRLLIGVPGKSNAFSISRRLGLPEEIIARAIERIDAEKLHFEDVLSELECKRQEAERERQTLLALRLELEDAKRREAEHREQLEAEREDLLRSAREEARQLLAEARRTAGEVISDLNSLRKRKEGIGPREENDAKSRALGKLNRTGELVSARKNAAKVTPARAIVSGDMVEVLSVGAKASVLAVNPDGSLSLQAGILKISAKQDEVRLLEKSEAKPPKTHIPRTERKLRAEGASSELDLRGMTSDEAEAVLDQFLDNALLSHLSAVTVIHGKGTGALRAAVHRRIKGNRAVKSFRLGHYGEGDHGVTVVEF